MIRMMMMGCLFSVLTTVLAGVGCWVVTTEASDAVAPASKSSLPPTGRLAVALAADDRDGLLPRRARGARH